MLPEMTQWYYTKVGLKQGPVPESELLQKIRRGEIDGGNLVWKEGMADWLPLSRVPELSGQAPSDASRAAAAPEAFPAKPEIPFPVHQPGGTVPLPQPAAYHGNFVAPVIQTYIWQSVVALVLSAVMMIFICIPIGMPFGIVALVFASKVEGLRLQGRLAEAESASKSAKIWMIISYSLSGLVLFGLFVVFVIALIAGGITP